MTPEEIAKAVSTAVTAEVTKVTAPLTATIAKLELDLAIERMPQAHREFCKAMSDEDKKKFADKKPEERDADCADAMKKAAGDPVVKALQSTVEDLTKRLAASDERDAVLSFAKQAKDLGLPEAHGEVMRKAFAGDAASIAKHNELIKGLTEQIKTGKVFAEFGSKGTGAEQSAFDKITAKAEELRKADPKLTQAQAFDKAYNDPSNTDLREQHKTEETRKRQAA